MMINLTSSPRRGMRHNVTISYEDEERREKDDTPTQDNEVIGSNKSLQNIRKVINFSDGNGKQNSKRINDGTVENYMFFPVEKCKFHDLYDWRERKVQFIKSDARKPETGTVVTCNQKKIALFRYGDIIYAIDEHCPHMGGPLHLGNLETIGEAKLLCVVCPWHKWRIEITSGKLRQPAGRGICNQIYPTEVLPDGTIRVGFAEIANDYFSMEFDF